jgi:hypothetical protein
MVRIYTSVLVYSTLYTYTYLAIYWYVRSARLCRLNTRMSAALVTVVVYWILLYSLSVRYSYCVRPRPIFAHTDTALAIVMWLSLSCIYIPRTRGWSYQFANAGLPHLLCTSISSIVMKLEIVCASTIYDCYVHTLIQLLCV